jgi:N-acetyl-anhydromuramyl-L-alanine amidase AmpD
MLVDHSGMAVHPTVRIERRRLLERGPMPVVRGIIVHQTGGSTAASTLASYARAGAHGAHFLIERDGRIYQTASLFQSTLHVGKLKARCLSEHRRSAVDTANLRGRGPSAQHQVEMTKEVPDRFPSNSDSIGIELVGAALPRGTSVKDDDKVYESVTKAQNAALSWLIFELRLLLRVPLTEIFRHPDAARENSTEAQTARW